MQNMHGIVEVKSSAMSDLKRLDIFKTNATRTEL